MFSTIVAMVSVVLAAVKSFRAVWITLLIPSPLLTMMKFCPVVRDQVAISKSKYLNKKARSKPGFLATVNA